jgi:hypothetical protein
VIVRKPVVQGQRGCSTHERFCWQPEPARVRTFTFVQRFPTRTIVLMILALLSFAWFWWKTHQREQRALTITPIVLLDGGAP